MTKLTPLLSIEHAIRQALALLGDDGAEQAIRAYLGVRRSSSLIRKCADPDDRAHHIQLRYAIALDLACIAAGHPPPMLEAHRHALDTADSDGPPEVFGDLDESELSSAVLAVQAALGDLAREVIHAKEPESPAGKELSTGEKHQIFHSVGEIETHIREIKAILANQNR